MRKSMVLLLATTLAGCSLLGPGSPSDEQMAAADYGPRPSNDEIVLVAKRDALGHAVFKGIQAKDIQVVHSEPQTGWCGEKRRGFQFGWLVEVTATSGKAQMQKSYLLQQRPHGQQLPQMAHPAVPWWRQQPAPCAPTAHIRCAHSFPADPPPWNCRSHLRKEKLS